MPKELSKLAMQVNPSTTLEIDALFKQMKADGIDVVGFGAGEPDFPTPRNIKDAVINALENNFTKYTPVAGTIDLKKAVVSRAKADLGLDYEIDQVVATSGAKHVIYTALMCILDEGDEVIIPTPYWISYSEMVKQARGVSVFVPATEEDNFKVTAEKIEKAITPKTKAVFLNSPSNPTGMLYTKEELEAIARVCVKHDIYVIADEIYYKLVYDKKEFVSFASLGEDVKDITILIHGVSKSYCMTGFRIGYALCNKKLAKVMTNYLSHSTSNACSLSQVGATEALNGDQTQIDAMVVEFEKRRNYIVERINNIDGVSCLKPEGAFYVLMNMSSFVGKKMYGKVIENDSDFAKLFLEKGLVATVPCEGFGAKNLVRWSYATSMEEIKKGIDRLEDFIKNA